MTNRKDAGATLSRSDVIKTDDADTPKYLPVTDAVDAFLIDGLDAVNAWIGPSTQHEKPEYTASYVQACATIHGAQLIADALSKNAELLVRLIDSKTRTGG